MEKVDYQKLYALQDEFVNDRVKYFGRPKRIKNIRVDNLKNIYTNKVTALISRDEAKDVVDIWTIDRFFGFNVKEILDLAKEKMLF